ncbi:DJ-1/PfpI family protein [Lichenifustis flavocetrariae]|uniref:DJ-1/PfpI family protein n=1 Tax=Lichenifustis flavocetrariae TaxID=2949735 RepID=A0AA41Z1E9_9HYPH|nr:DJ-1/PfpI family protein [Lichenifustis flavocetrariae]MCW6512434.1 DJ-1/PfpI family protein [Lichenifustis flavocetrariae]
MPLSFGLLVFPDVQQLDLTAPYEIFASAEHATVHLLWKDLEPVRSSTGLWLRPSTTFADCPPLDVLCVPGGSGVNALMQDEEVLDFVRHSAAAVRYLTSVCTGSLVLGAAGLLKGRRATTHWNAHDFLERFGALPTQGRVVRDGNLITAGGVTSGIDFGLTVLAELCGTEEAQSVQLGLEYAPEPPFEAGTPDSAPAHVLEFTRRRLAASRRQREQLLTSRGI